MSTADGRELHDRRHGRSQQSEDETYSTESGVQRGRLMAMALHGDRKAKDALAEHDKQEGDAS